MDTAVGDRFPHLELSLALIAATAGLMTAANSGRMGLIPISWEAGIAGAVIGAITGAVLRQRCRREPGEGGGWIAMFVTCVAAGSLIGASVCMVVPHTVPTFIPPPAIDGLFIGGVIAAAAFPGCHWLLGQARECVRARQGSLIADADRRAVWSATSVVLALLSLAAIPTWDGDNGRFFYGPQLFDTLCPTLGAGIAALSATIALEVFIRDALSFHRVQKLELLEPELDPLHFATDEDFVPETDLGIGDAIAGKHEASSSYRGTAVRIPLVRGSLSAAALVLHAARTASRNRLLLTLAIVAIHAPGLA